MSTNLPYIFNFGFYLSQFSVLFIFGLNIKVLLISIKVLIVLEYFCLMSSKTSPYQI
uniref:Uncharacterized protein n=1 Tax=Populus trichocarpa TaxID=3694 RepID=A9PAE6_POPTR|nr:unknown [Populus trichocarpa]